jgi:hypothetical protein
MAAYLIIKISIAALNTAATMSTIVKTISAPKQEGGYNLDAITPSVHLLACQLVVTKNVKENVYAWITEVALPSAIPQIHLQLIIPLG